MLATIKSISIENFRSIRSLYAELKHLSVFVGKNDCGKSNILRALNLFFNGETNPGTPFSFTDDYNFFAPARARKAKEVVVSVEIALPPSYHKTNGQVVIWRKVWREDGQWSEDYDYIGQRISTNRRNVQLREDVVIPDKSNVHALLRKIEFEYVPAIKDSDYFDDLRGRIYGIISDVAARTFHESSAAFEQSIGDHLNDLTSSITSSLGFNTRLALPRDLYHIFERLDFLSGDKSVSLNNRGDGIKARHIPLILKFMAEKKAALQRRGGSPISSVWAYEEPENNLEIASAVQLADEFLSLSQAGTAQILLTTHSPAFYDLGQREHDVGLNFVTRNVDLDGTEINADPSSIDDSLGTLAMLAPRIAEMVSEVRKQEAARVEAKRLLDEQLPRIFVEGESDRLILQRGLSLFFPDAVDRLRFETKRQGAGHNYVIDMLTGWRSQHKHHPDRPKAAGIVDGDASQARTDYNSNGENVRSAKCFIYPTPQHVRAPLAAGFRIPCTLEVQYPVDIWRQAEANGHLVPRDPLKIYPSQLANQILRGEAQIADQLHPDWAIFVTSDFDPQQKVRAAARICRLDEEACRVILAPFEPLLREVLGYLGITPSVANDRDNRMTRTS